VTSVLDRLFGEPVRVRREIVRVLFESVDDVGMRVLHAMAVSPGDPNMNVRWEIAQGLAEAEHPGAVALLEEIARTDPDDTVRSQAIGSLGERALAAYRAKEGPEAATPRAISVRTRGAVRTRGTSPLRQVSPAAGEILELINRIRDEEGSESVRYEADLTLRQLGD
jgi:HEAT repeat protein